MFVYETILFFTSTEVVNMFDILVVPTSEELGLKLMINSTRKTSGFFCGDKVVSRLPPRGGVGASPILNVSWLPPTKVRVD